MAKSKDELMAAPGIAEARAAFDKASRIVKAFSDAEKVLAMLENLDQVVKERTAAAEAALARVNELQAQQATANAELQAAKLKARELVEDAAERVRKQTEEAEVRSKQMVADAESKTYALVEEQERVVADLLAKQKEISGLEKQAAAARTVIERAEKIRSAMA